MGRPSHGWVTRICDHCRRPFERRVSHLRGRPTRFCSRTCNLRHLNTPTRNAAVAKATATKRGDRLRGRTANPHGPTSYPKRGGRHEHRVVMEQVLGRLLQPDEIVHHHDGNKRNNAPSNLYLTNRGDHFRHHVRGEEVIP